MRQMLRLLAAMGLMLAMAARPSSASPIVSFDPAVSSVSVGQTFQVDVTITDAADLYAFQFDVAFNPALVRVNSVTEGPFLPDWGSSLVPPVSTLWDPGTIDNVGGSVALVNNVLLGGIPPGAGATGSGVLARIEFTALMAGTGSLVLLNDFFLNSVLDVATVERQSGRLDVKQGAVPEPTTGLLLLCGLAALTTKRLRRRR